MEIISKKNDLRKRLGEIRQANPAAKVGLVPTMGYLHKGHKELIRTARKESDVLVVSIFINPLQFNEESDFQNYPVDKERDQKICKEAGVDVIFCPKADEMYDTRPLLEMRMPALTFNLCGEYRPGHFEGVLLVVARLFGLVQPHKAWFGKKDYQQFLVIRQLARDLEIPTEVIGLPTVREEDGLAVSSRNARLSPRAREQAGLIYRGLKIAEKEFREGCLDPKELIEIAKDVIESGSLNQVEYLEIVSPKDLQPIADLQEEQAFLLASAVFCEGVRLIDNLEVLP